MRSLAILQARTGSSRLPGKVLKQINDKPMLEWQIDRILQSNIEKLVLATTTNSEDDKLVNHFERLGIVVRRGPDLDVYSRFKNILQEFNPKFFLRFTGDCPLTMPTVINQMLSQFEVENPEYLSNTIKPTYPDGLDVEIVDTKIFMMLDQLGLTQEEREHVTLKIYRNPNLYKLTNFANAEDLSDLRWTVDYDEDFQFVARVFSEFNGRESTFSISDVIALCEAHPEIINTYGPEMRNITLKNTIKSESS